MKKIVYLMIVVMSFMCTISFAGEMKIMNYSDSALDEALNDGLNVALWFTDDNDPVCQEQAASMLRNGQFLAATEDLAWFKVNLTGYTNKKRYADLMDVYDITELPTVIYIGDDNSNENEVNGNVTERVIIEKRFSGYQDSNDMLIGLIAGALISWIVIDNWYDNDYYNNRFVIVDGGWWHGHNDWVYYGHRYWKRDRYVKNRYPHIPYVALRDAPRLPPANRFVKPVLKPSRPNNIIRPGFDSDRPNNPGSISKPGFKPDRPSNITKPDSRPNNPSSISKPGFKPDRPSNITKPDSKPRNSGSISKPGFKPGGSGSKPKPKKDEEHKTDKDR